MLSLLDIPFLLEIKIHEWKDNLLKYKNERPIRRQYNWFKKMIDSIQKNLENKGIYVKQDWVEQCLNFIKTDNSLIKTESNNF